ncbi:TPA: tail fiber domain-containing protein [Salmonella enterica subsp. enterica serovar Kentucky]|uniref:Tail fiber domain-containing protein n=2 Tax=Salmonella enterica I TaxID=59201 RepID=A0A3U0F3G6_SALET|nr:MULTISPECIES: tail fiber domain-containing protein [Salmonella]EEG0865176.1 tail fiber domain-containing protein [Salmonella enterica subsp. enterica serovar Litchfield]MBY6248857.1 tail fiber domain-containing protein [Citrobacter werkmanii]HAC8334436.1 tail fiber domain-containing protein [Salmonella enterica subsp. enterica]EAA2751442.1 tail fiber domain-containing protein [Salmonella enterica subsp. enterica serovar Kentucky]EAX0684682.1 tail fiber domain-containing protein [Salmonella 
MSAGTLTLTNNSAAVAGNGTAFTTEVAAGDFIVVTIGGVPYTLPVKSVESGTALTLVSNFTGPTQSGAAWSAVPRVALNMVTAALVAQSAEALRGLNYDKQNWQQFFTADGDVTITLPDTSQTTGPSAKKLISSVVNKADKVDGVVPKEQGGTGLSQPFGDKAGQFCQGNDSRLNSVNGKAGGKITSTISAFGEIKSVNETASEPGNGVTINGASVLSVHNIAGVDRAVASIESRYTWGQPVSDAYINCGLLSAQGGWVSGSSYRFSGGGDATAPGSWINGASDARVKSNVKPIENPKSTMRKITAATWNLDIKGQEGRFGIGVLANGLYDDYPEASINVGDKELSDGTIISDVLSVQAGDSGVLAAVHHATILELMDDVDELKKIIESLKSK